MSQPVVLNTRPRDQAAELTALLRASGCAVLEIPAIAVAPTREPLRLQPPYAWLVLTSANAGRFLAAGLGGALPDAPVLCGTSTARALRLVPALALDTFSAAAALEALRPRLHPGERVLLPRSADGREELLTGLLDFGVAVDAPTCYRTVARPEAFAGLPEIDVVTLCSPSAAQAVIGGAGHERLRAMRVVCLGQTTARAVRAAGVRVDRVASSTSVANLVEAVASVLEVLA